MTADPGDELRRLLEPDERVLWSARPYYPNFRPETRAAFAFGLLLLVPTLFAAFMLVMLAYQLMANWDDKGLTGVLILLAAAAGFGSIAWQCLSTPWVVRRRLEGALYAVTDRRVIASKSVGYAFSATVPVPHQELFSFTPEQARSRSVRRHRGGRVDLVLARERHRAGRSHLDVEIGVLGAQDWQAAAEAMDAAFGGGG